MAIGNYQPVIAQPSSGGDLVTLLSGENVGGSNYVVKRDWRRILDAEVRREGHVQFAPDPDVDPDDQFLIPNGLEINLVHHSRKPNGQAAVIIGTSTTLYRYYSLEDGGVYTSDVYEADVFSDSSGVWLAIGDNFSESGNRWEAKDVAGKTVFNNGVDLPVIYDLAWLQVKPVYELRDQGIAFAGTIEEYDGMLVLGDLAELKNDTITSDVMNGRNVTGVSQTGTTVTGSSDTFDSTDIGKTILFSTGESALILASPTTATVTVDKTQTVASTSARVAILYGTVSSVDQYDRTQYRLLVSNIGDPEDFGDGSLTTDVVATQPYVGLVNRTFAFEAGDVIIIPGADTAGAALEATVLSVNGTHDTLTIDTPIVTAVSGVLVQKKSRLASTSAAFDLQDDGSAIIRIQELQGRLIVLKESSIFVGAITGLPDPPLQFQKVYGGAHCIAWKWMLARVNGEHLIYATGTDFYTFSLSSLTPRVHDKLQLCKNLFFNVATDLSLFNNFWAADNVITREIWFMFPKDGGDEVSDQAICYDYVYNTCSTLAHAYTAGASVKKPVSGAQIGVGEDWFVLGDQAGRIYTYGLTNLTSGVWTRDLSLYDSILRSGLIDGSNEFDEVDLRNYVLYFARFNTPVVVKLYGTRNANETATALFTKTIAAPAVKTLIPTYFRKNYYQDEVTVTGQSTDAAIVRRIFEFQTPDSRSTIRNDST